MPKPRVDPVQVIGRAPEELSLLEATELVGKVVAIEIYTPERLPLRRIEAIGDSPEECIRALAERGLDPRRYEFTVLKPPY